MTKPQTLLSVAPREPKSRLTTSSTPSTWLCIHWKATFCHHPPSDWDPLPLELFQLQEEDSEQKHVEAQHNCKDEWKKWKKNRFSMWNQDCWRKKVYMYLYIVIFHFSRGFSVVFAVLLLCLSRWNICQNLKITTIPKVFPLFYVAYMVVFSHAFPRFFQAKTWFIFFHSV